MSIHKAVQAGHIEAVKQHLVDGTDANAKGDDGEAPLDLAVYFAQIETADLIRKYDGKRPIFGTINLGDIVSIKER